MSSATSIDRVNADRVREAESANRGASPRDAFRPWHFFVLASLIAATTAVVMARQSRPEHLILISVTIGAAGLAGAALFRTLLPLVRGDQPSAEIAPLTDSLRTVLEREKLLVLRSIKELEFDRAMGKVSPKDFDEMAGRLRTRAMSLMRQLDAGGGYKELIERELAARLRKPVKAKRPAMAEQRTANSEQRMPDSGAAEQRTTNSEQRTCACGTINDPDAAFCKRCGTRFERPVP